MDRRDYERVAEAVREFIHCLEIEPGADDALTLDEIRDKLPKVLAAKLIGHDMVKRKNFILACLPSA